MDDQGFDFQKPPERREKGRFEIPPWEQEAFEELRRRQGEQPQEAQAEPGQAGEGSGARGAASASTAGQQAAAAAEAGGSATGGESVTAPGVAASGEPAGAALERAGAVEPKQAAKPGPSEAQVTSLLAGLASQEPDMKKDVGRVWLGTAIVLLPLGVVLMVWGMGGFVKARVAMQTYGQATGAQMQLAAGTMLLFGAGFIVGAVWLVYRYLRQRGVI